MNDVYTEYTLPGNRKLICEQDTDAQSPRNTDVDMTHIVTWHSRYLLGDANVRRPNDRKEYEKIIRQAIKDVGGEPKWAIGIQVVLTPLYAYEHGGIKISTSPFNDYFDSGQVGIVVALKRHLLQHFGELLWSETLDKRTASLIDSEVAEVSDYLEGNVFSMHVSGTDEKEPLDIYGFYGTDIIDNGMLSHLSLEDIEHLKATKQITGFELDTKPITEERCPQCDELLLEEQDGDFTCGCCGQHVCVFCQATLKKGFCKLCAREED